MRQGHAPPNAAWKRNPLGGVVAPEPILTDPQTSGGLLIACAAGRAEAIRSEIEVAGYPRARVIGTVVAGEPRVHIV